jgi:hypothetical protein
MGATKGDIFAFTFAETLITGAQTTRRLFIERPQRKLQIKRVFLDIQLQDTITNLFVSWENNQYITANLLLYGENYPDDKVTSLFRPVGFIPTPFQNGTRLQFFNPGQWIFDNMYIKNMIEVNYTVGNPVGLNAFNVLSALVIETFASIIY